MTKKEVFAKLREDIQKNGGDQPFKQLKLKKGVVLVIEGHMDIDKESKDND